MSDLLRQNGWYGRPDAPAFLGPRIDWGYAAFGIRPSRGLPLWWELLHYDHHDRTDEMVERFKGARFRMCIFLYKDYTYFPRSLTSYLEEAYEVCDMGELTVHVLREITPDTRYVCGKCRLDTAEGGSRFALEQDRLAVASPRF